MVADGNDNIGLRREESLRQLAAGIALLNASYLVRWKNLDSHFESVSEAEFEKKASLTHPIFGRLMLWLLFSTGSEYLLKGALIWAGEFSPNTKATVLLPTKQTPWTSEWISEVISNRLEKIDSADYLTIGKLDGHLKRLCNGRPDGDDVRVAFKLLAEAIRNRDAHAYVRGVRASHHHMASHFAQAYSIMVGWLDVEIVLEAANTAPNTSEN